MICLALQTPVVVAQEVPPSILKTFQKMFSQAEDLSWEDEDKLFFASFYDNNYSKEAVFDSTGKWLRTTTDLYNEQGLPESITNYISKKYGEVDIYSVILSEQPNITRYDISFETENEDTYNLSFDENGNLIEEEE